MDSGTNCNYVFPGDPTNPSQWSECESHNNTGDLRFVITMGDFTILPGESSDMTVAFISTFPDIYNGCPKANFDSIKIYADTAWANYQNPFITDSVNGVANISTAGQKWILYPNPASDKLYITQPGSTLTGTITIYNTLGQSVYPAITRISGQITLDLVNLVPGLYLIKYTDSEEQQNSMFIKK